jgi:AraC-like DNA-binding protein
MHRQGLSKEEKQRIYLTKGYLCNHQNKAVTVAQLARHSALGIKKFREGFALLFEMTIQAYLHQTRLQTGKHLLLHTDKPVKEIAALCGYGYYKNFITAYRKFFGQTPYKERKNAGG